MKPPSKTQQEAKPTHYVQSLERGLRIIESFDRGSPAMTIAEVAEKTELTRGTAQRFLLTLVDLGYADYDGKRFSLRPRVLNIGFAYLASNDVWEAVEPFLEDVVNELNESCTVGVLDWPDVVYVARIQARRVVNAALAVGSRIPAHASSLGHVLLAHVDDETLASYLTSTTLEARTARTVTTEKALKASLAKIRKQGWALGDQEFEDGVRSVSVPLHDRQGRVIAAMKVVAPTSRATKSDLQNRFLPVLQDAAARAECAIAAH